ncbi:hypothetical protein [Enterobacter kobei]|uniref:hypothetical protein n=1 Tax=Enterobacter kobei TaxID=208224 RepID=UPI002003ED27|nr:hypothetical protein [Enterobacter kobei]ELE9740163.1 hypothetical protein [Enterobacter kobei]MCK7293317.1 hypothetical protein [Enterobacter kobei]HEP1033790.1 hypothetical protein [Enterobacter kobei]
MSIDDLYMRQEEWALEMLGRSGALTPCTHHEGVYIDEGIELSEAYKYAMTAYKNSNGKSPFESASEMTDAIKSAYEDHGGNDLCPLCTSHVDD